MPGTTVVGVYRFLLTRRWLGLAVVVAVLAVLCVRLGLWQLHRGEERRATNVVTERNLDAAAAPSAEVMSAGDAPAAGDLWRRVQVTGTYDEQQQVSVKYQTRDGEPGVDVVTPLRTSDGTAVLVDRGWLGTGNTPDVGQLPPPPGGTVTVTGWLRADSTADLDATTPDGGQVRAVSSEGFSAVLPYPVAGGYLDLLEQAPPAADGLAAPVPPDLGQGPHFFYGLQWFFFGGLAVFGWFYFAWTEAHPRPRRRTRDERGVEYGPGEDLGPDHVHDQGPIQEDDHAPAHARARDPRQGEPPGVPTPPTTTAGRT